MKKICVLGLGYIGLPTAAMFAEQGHEVIGVDVNETIVHLLNEGRIHIEEKGLEDLVKKAIKNGKLRAATSPEFADVFVIAVPTPIYADHTANLQYLEEATRSIIPYVNNHNIVIVESTIPPRTMDDIIAPIFRNAGWDVGNDLFLAHCPERVLPGRILDELVNNTRIVGGINKLSARKAAAIYQSFVKGDIEETSALSAEMSKLMENTFRDVNIALANELVKISSKLGVDALEVIQLANKHPRVNIHQPGPGVGGHCLAVDPYFIIEKAPESSPLITHARNVNNSMPEFVVSHVEKLVNPYAKIAVCGLSYKGNTDDLRESPAMEVVSMLSERRYELAIHDPHVKQEQVDYQLVSFEEAISGASCLLILADHDEFKLLDENKILSGMASAVILDSKNCVRIHNNAITYYNFGNIFEIESSRNRHILSI